MNNVQFGRYVEVEIRDYNSQTKTIIGNEFEIEFDYYKSLDQTTQDDTGTIKIYGLTPERVETLQTEGGEVILRCGYLKSEISILFLASIVRLWYDVQGNTTVTTIECSANVLNYYHIGSRGTLGGIRGTNNTVIEFLVDISRDLGLESYDYSLDVIADISPELVEPVNQVLLKYPMGINIAGTAQSRLDTFCENYGFEFHRKAISSGEEHGVFLLKSNFSQHYINLSKSEYKPYLLDLSKTKEGVRFFKTLAAKGADPTYTELSFDTGLISSKTEYKIAKVYEYGELKSNETETLSSEEKREAAYQKFLASEAKKEAAAIKNGKVYAKKEYQEKYIEVTRKYLRVKALLNPLVLPQSMVAIESSRKADESGGTYTVSVSLARVRHATYKANNKRNDWIMDLYCETPHEEAAMTQADKDAIFRTSSPDSLEIEDDGYGEEQDLSGLDGGEQGFE